MERNRGEVCSLDARASNNSAGQASPAPADDAALGAMTEHIAGTGEASIDSAAVRRFIALQEPPLPSLRGRRRLR
jgi:hypothetical protein